MWSEVSGCIALPFASLSTFAVFCKHFIAYCSLALLDGANLATFDFNPDDQLWVLFPEVMPFCFLLLGCFEVLGVAVLCYLQLSFLLRGVR